MHAIKDLPEYYHNLKTLNLSNTRAVISMNLAAIPLLFLFGWFFTRSVYYFQPGNPPSDGFLGIISIISIWRIIAVILSIILMLVFHELVHGIFFWLFTHERPKFALKAGYAFAAAPEWYLPKFQYVMVGLSPFIIISLVSIVLAWNTSPILSPYFILIATFNAAGSLGDLIVVGWVLRQPKTIFIKDEGDIFSSYAP
jgi:hypothetical protein